EPAVGEPLFPTVPRAAPPRTTGVVMTNDGSPLASPAATAAWKVSAGNAGPASAPNVPSAGRPRSASGTWTGGRSGRGNEPRSSRGTCSIPANRSSSRPERWREVRGAGSGEDALKEREAGETVRSAPDRAGAFQGVVALASTGVGPLNHLEGWVRWGGGRRVCLAHPAQGR